MATFSYLAATASGAATGVVLYLVLIPTFGLMGAALGFVLGEVVVAAVGYSLLPRELHDSWKNPLLGVALAGALLMFVAIRLVNAHTTQIFTVVSAGAGAYLLSCGWFIRKTLVGQVAGTR